MCIMRRSSNTSSTIHVLELFAGIGGMHFAFQYAGIDTQHTVVDINPLCMDTYRHNFPNSRIVMKDVVTLPLTFFEYYDVWTLSPPCQPYTKQPGSKQKDTKDLRSNGLGFIGTSILCKLKQEALPLVILLENVEPFKFSESWKTFSHQLEERGYFIETFVLSPRQFGFPNERTRFYIIASLSKTMLEDPIYTKTMILSYEDKNKSSNIIYDNNKQQPQKTTPVLAPFYIPSILNFLDDDINKNLYVSDKLLQHHAASCFDIISKRYSRNICCYSYNKKLSNCSHNNDINLELLYNSNRYPPEPFKTYTACFTKSYGRYIRATGSILYENDDDDDNDFNVHQAFGKLRYFSPTEIALLMGFKMFHSRNDQISVLFTNTCSSSSNHQPHLCLPIPFCSMCPSTYYENNNLINIHQNTSCICQAFEFPSHLNLRQQYALLGNALNPQVVAILIRRARIDALLKKSN